MSQIKGSETEKNLLKAFAGESQARNRYSFFSSVARDEGYEQISAIFQETADNEKEHAKIFFEHLQKSEGSLVEITAQYPAGKISKTEENLLESANGEKLEWSSIYPNFAEIAKKEGFRDIADSFKQIGEVEEKHEERYRKLLENLKGKKVFKRKDVTKWKCRNCGYIHEGKEAPKVCPACKHPQAFYELFAENY
jgi:rubrerythrin